jgi:hypothetical protein
VEDQAIKDSYLKASWSDDAPIDFEIWACGQMNWNSRLELATDNLVWALISNKGMSRRKGLSDIVCHIKNKCRKH